MYNVLLRYTKCSYLRESDISADIANPYRVHDNRQKFHFLNTADFQFLPRSRHVMLTDSTCFRFGHVTRATMSQLMLHDEMN